jgi:hypothetical protein
MPRPALVVFAVAAFGFSVFAEYRLWHVLREHAFLASPGHLDLTYQVAIAVLNGKAGPIFQNRLLTPLLVYGLWKGLGVAPWAALQTVILAAVALKNAALWGLARARGGDTAVYLVAWAALLGLAAALPNGVPLHAWDYPDAALTMLFLLLLAWRVSWPWFVPLFLLALTNREVALVMPAALLARELLAGGGWRRGGLAVLVAGTLAGSGFGLMAALRSWRAGFDLTGAQAAISELLIQPDWSFLRVGGVAVMQIQVLPNLRALLDSLAWPAASALSGASLHITLFLATVAAALIACRRALWRAAPVELTAFLLVALATLVSGIYGEGRVFVPWLPYLAALALATGAGRRPAGDDPGGHLSA